MSNREGIRKSGFGVLHSIKINAFFFNVNFVNHTKHFLFQNTNWWLSSAIWEPQQWLVTMYVTSRKKVAGSSTMTRRWLSQRTPRATLPISTFTSDSDAMETISKDPLCHFVINLQFSIFVCSNCITFLLIPGTMMAKVVQILELVFTWITLMT